MAKYHEAGRFSEDLAPDMESALYHLKKAARGGVTDALYTLAHIYLQQPHDDFKEISVEVCVCVCVCVCVHVHMCVCMCVCTCVCEPIFTLYMYV